MCVDYRSLNHFTIRDRFPIANIDELFDELQGSKFFTNLDLKSGYPQIWMFNEDIPKSVFHMHHGHYEFNVMSFGLSNAPSTIQSLMNKIFQDYLCGFVLVLFNDIYSVSWELHLEYLT